MICISIIYIVCASVKEIIKDNKMEDQEHVKIHNLAILFRLKSIIIINLTILGFMIPFLYMSTNKTNLVGYILNSHALSLILIAVSYVLYQGFLKRKVEYKDYYFRSQKDIKCIEKNRVMVFKVFAFAIVSIVTLVFYYCSIKEIETYKFAQPEMFQIEEEFIDFMANGEQYGEPILNVDGDIYVTILTGDRKGEKIKLECVEYDKGDVQTYYINMRDDVIKTSLKIVDKELTYRVFITENIEEGKIILEKVLLCVRVVIYTVIILFYVVYIYKRRVIYKKEEY